MKTYKPLSIPEDSAWERSTLFGRLHWRIRNFLTSCNNIIKWFPTIWNDRDWDDSFILKILQKKIEFQRKELVNANRHTRIEQDNRDMTLALNLLERVRENYYELECLDYWDSNVMFEDIPNITGHKLVDVVEKWEKYDEFLSKYPSSVRAVIKEHGEQEDKQRLCLMVSQYNHYKANKLLFRILEERLAYWWD